MNDYIKKLDPMKFPLCTACSLHFTATLQFKKLIVKQVRIHQARSVIQQQKSFLVLLVLPGGKERQKERTTTSCSLAVEWICFTANRESCHGITTQQHVMLCGNVFKCLLYNLSPNNMLLKSLRTFPLQNSLFNIVYRSPIHLRE